MVTVMFCEKCYKEENEPLHGFIPNSNLDICPFCKNIMKKTNMSIDDYFIITELSKDINFLQAMIDLKEKDVIEYELKMSQFRVQVEQQKSTQSKVEEDNRPKCPTCNSTNIKRISGTSKAVSVALFGLLSQKVKKQWHCNNCGSEW